MSKWSDAREVRRVAERLIGEKFQERLLNDAEVLIVYVFTHKEITDRGQSVPGKARKKSGLDAYMIQREMGVEEIRESFFLIEINSWAWGHHYKTPEEQEALLYHYLRRLQVDVDFDKKTMRRKGLKLSIVSPDFEAFRDEIEAYGLWHKPLREFAELATPHLEQLELSLEESEEEKSAESTGATAAVVTHDGRSEPLGSPEGNALTREWVEDSQRELAGAAH